MNTNQYIQPNIEFAGNEKSDISVSVSINTDKKMTKITDMRLTFTHHYLGELRNHGTDLKPDYKRKLMSEISADYICK